MENYPGGYMSMGQTAENVANDYGFTREQMDEMALESHTRAAQARLHGKLAPSIIPYVKEDGTVVDYDDGILAEMDGTLKTSMEKMATLKTCFVAAEDGGKVTAATSSQTTDAAAYVMIMDSDYAAEHGHQAHRQDDRLPGGRLRRHPYGHGPRLCHPQGSEAGRFLLCQGHGRH